MTKPTVIVGGVAVATAAAIGAALLFPPDKIIPVESPVVIQRQMPVDCGCEELRAFMDRDFAMRLRKERQAIFRDAAAVIRFNLAAQRKRNPQAAPPPGVEQAMHDLERRASE